VSELIELGSVGEETKDVTLTPFVYEFRDMQGRTWYTDPQ
jgi:hypothetical protein